MRLLSLLLIFLMPHLAYGKVDWQYKSFPFIKENSPLRKGEPQSLKVGNVELNPLLSQSGSTHTGWGVEQVYISRDLRQRVFVKYGVKLSKEALLAGGWVRLKKGHVLHLRNGPNFTAYFAQGLSSIQMHQLKQKLIKSIPKSARTSDCGLFLCSAHAEVAERPRAGAAGAAAASEAPMESADPSWLSRAGNISMCVGSETLENAKATAVSLYENATWQNIKSGAASAASTAWEAVPTREEVGEGLKSSWNFIRDTWNDPEQAWEDVQEGFDQTMQAIAQIGSEVAKSVEGFAELDPEIQDRLICEAVSFFAARGVLSLLIGATGAGTSIAVARLTATALEFARKIKPTMGMIRYVSGEPNFDMNAKLEIIGLILKGDYSKINRSYFEVGAALTNRFARSGQIAFYTRRGFDRNHSIVPGTSYTAILDGDTLVLGREIPGLYDGRPGGSGSHLNLRDMRKEMKREIKYEGGAVRFNADGSVDISGYRRLISSPESVKLIEDAIRRIDPNAVIRSTPGRLPPSTSNNWPTSSL